MSVKNQVSKRIMMYIVCCHADKLVQDTIPSSKYDVFIQAGAALTDKRVCEINDMDNLPGNISDRNQRYCEMTALYYIGQNIKSDYVGISHYRRRFLITDDELDKMMDEGFDIITSPLYHVEKNIDEKYQEDHYGYDWKLLMDIIDELSPDDKAFALSQYSKSEFHPCNMNIFSANIYKEYCDWIFPLLDEFYKRSCTKTDMYQRRDIGFIAERLSSLFIEKKRIQGAKIVECPYKEYNSSKWEPADVCNLSDYQEVYNKCEEFYARNDILKCRRLVAGALGCGGASDRRLYNLALIFKIALEEQKTLPMTMFEYMPEMWRKDLKTLLSTFDGLCQILNVLKTNSSPEAAEIYRDFITQTGFSDITIEYAKKILG